MYDHLRKKGWSEEELHHLSHHYDRKKESLHVLFLALGIILAAIVLIPWAYTAIAAFLPEAVLILILVSIGVPLGGVLGILLVDIELLEKHHHLLLLCGIPVATLILVLFIFAAANINQVFDHNPFIAALAYAASIAIPYAVLVKYEWTSRIGRWNT